MINVEQQMAKIVRNAFDIDINEDLKDIPDEYLMYVMKQSSQASERLEFLGDSVLDLIVADILMEDLNYLSPGKMTEVRSNIVKNISLSGYSRIKGICSDIQDNGSATSTKKCSNRFEILIGVIYLYTNRDIDIVYDFLESTVGLSNMINNNDPSLITRYGKWNPTVCNRGKMTMTRDCLGGLCTVMEKEVNCPVVCRDGFRESYNDKGELVIEQCNKVSKCDEHGIRSITGPLLDTTEVCPDELYNEELRYDTSCKSGNVKVYRTCKDTDNCEDVLWDSYPCSDEFPIPDDFVNMDEDEKWEIYEKLRDRLHVLTMNWDVDSGYTNLYPMLYTRQ